MKKILFIFTSLCLFHCSDVIVPDISTEEVDLLAPIDQATLIGQSVHFNWHHLTDALDYQIEVVSPSFDSILYWIVDSITTENNLILELSPGVYQWRVHAYNEAYTSACCQQQWSFLLHSDSTLNLSQFEVSLTAPTHGLQLNSDVIDFTWNDLDAATTYAFELSQEINFNNLLSRQSVSTPNLSYEISTEGAYYWRVRAENDLSNTFTDWQSRSFVVDQSPPDIAVLLTPLNNDTLHFDLQSPDLSWSSAGDASVDSLFIYTDLNQDQLFIQTLATGGEFDFDTTVVTLNTGAYFWSIRSYDQAGNASLFSEIRQFIVE